MSLKLTLSYVAEIKENTAFVAPFLGFPVSHGQSIAHLLTASFKGRLTPRVLSPVNPIAAFVEGCLFHRVCGQVVLRHNYSLLLMVAEWSQAS